MGLRRLTIINILLLKMLAMVIPSACRKANRAVANYSGDIDEAWQARGNATKRLQDYHEFEDLYQLVKGNKATLLMRINSGEQFKDLTQEVMIINDWISKYNSRSRQYDRALWKSDSLPYQLELITSVEDLRK